MLSGYTGKIAWIDLSEETVRVEALEEGVARKYLGGKGLGAYFLHRCLAPRTDPYDPSNLLIFMTGPLTGTTLPAISRSAVITKSPLTGTFLDSYSGGFFGPRLKFAGYDALIVTGKAKRPSYILVDDGEIRIRDAGDLWGLSTAQCEALLKGEWGQGASVAAIGQAGEKLVRFANIINERRAHGRGGSGAVMGSKRLKAVVVKGNRKVKAADEGAFKEVLARCRQKVADHPILGRKGSFPRIGTMGTLDLTHETGTLPSRNWQENTSRFASAVGAEAFEKFILKPQACYACPVACSRETKATWKGIEYTTEGPEYETMYAFGANCEIKDPEVIIAADRLCDDYGMDTISCGVVIGFAMECREKGLLSGTDTGGIDLPFGDGDALLQLIRLIGEKQGIGELLSEGTRIASERIEDSSPFAMHVKGLELPGYDPRGMKGQGMTYALSDRGGCHLRSNTLRTELLGLPEKIDRYSYENKAKMIRDMQLFKVSVDSLIACTFGSFALSLQDYADALSALTGWSVDVPQLRTTAERVWNATRLFNVREGFSRDQDTLPERLFSQGSSKGPSKGQTVDRHAFDRMLDEYYTLAGWDIRTGIPAAEKVKELGIEDLL